MIVINNGINNILKKSIFFSNNLKYLSIIIITMNSIYYYTLQLKDQIYRYPNLFSVINTLFHIMGESSHIYQYIDKYLENIRIVSWINNIIVDEFRIKLLDGFILFNNDNSIRLTSIFTELYSMESLITKSILSSKINENITVKKRSTIPKKIANYISDNSNTDYDNYHSHDNNPHDNNPHNNDTQKNNHVEGDINNNTDDNTDDKNDIKSIDFTKKLNTMWGTKNVLSEMEIEIDKYPITLSQFIDDKNIYHRMVQDSIINVNNIHPVFILKYSVFEILDKKNELDFGSSINVMNEYESFCKLYEELLKMEKEIDDDNMEPYIPHNFTYMTPEQQEDYIISNNIDIDKILNN